VTDEMASPSRMNRSSRGVLVSGRNGLRGAPGWLWPVLAWSARVAVAVVFLLAAVPKIGDPAAFAMSVRGYRILPENLVPPVAVLLPWVELVAAGALFSRWRWRSAASLVLAGLLVLFMVAGASALMLGLDTSCGCFGGEGGEVIGSWLLARNTALIAALGAGMLDDWKQSSAA